MAQLHSPHFDLLPYKILPVHTYPPWACCSFTVRVLSYPGNKQSGPSFLDNSASALVLSILSSRVKTQPSSQLPSGSLSLGKPGLSVFTRRPGKPLLRPCREPAEGRSPLSPARLLTQAFNPVQKPRWSWTKSLWQWPSSEALGF